MSLVVKSHNPWKNRLLYLLALIALMSAGWGLYDYGRFSAGYDSSEANRAYAELLAINSDLEKQRVVLREQKAVLERAAQIEREAYNDLDATLKVLQGEILELKEELAFYRGIVSPRESFRGLRVQRVELQYNGIGRSYHYKIVLAQVVKNNQLASGKIRLQVDGSQGGEPGTLELSEITEKPVKELRFRFKYFQNIEGDIELPEKFDPIRLNVVILPSGHAQDKIVKAIDWPTEESNTHVGQKQETKKDGAN